MAWARENEGCEMQIARRSHRRDSSTIPTTVLGDSELEGETPDEQMVSKPIHPFILPISLWNKRTEQGIKVGALIDSGCTRCLITQGVVDKLNLKVIKLGFPIKFEQKNHNYCLVRSYPIEYEDLADVFKEDGTDFLPPHRTMDCAIELIPGVPLPKPRMFSMTQKELEKMKSHMAAPVLFHEKKDGSLRLCVDYRGF
ncbi:hypothetical protein E2320_019517 [Naja naja]|nr:hypothetical protein E2320_019517 [Naja naja]